jgi:hypothetical protein
MIVDRRAQYRDLLMSASDSLMLSMSEPITSAAKSRSTGELSA